MTPEICSPYIGRRNQRSYACPVSRIGRRVIRLSSRPVRLSACTGRLGAVLVSAVYPPGRSVYRGINETSSLVIPRRVSSASR